MVINGGARSSSRKYAAWLGAHLTRTDTNERVLVRSLYGVTAADDLADALAEMSAMAAGARSQRGLAHFNIDWKHGEDLTDAQKVRAVERLAEEHRLTGQPCAVVEHVKDGREHLHVVFVRIDPATGTAIHDGHNFRGNELVSRDLEREFGLERVQGVHAERDGIERPARTPDAHEFAQAARSGITPAQAKAALSALWQGADSGQAFAAALADAGWSLARGDRRDVLVALDPAGETHPINKRLTGLVAAQVRARIADLDAATLPSVDEARQAIRDQALDVTPQDVRRIEGHMDAIRQRVADLGQRLDAAFLPTLGERWRQAQAQEPAPGATKPPPGPAPEKGGMEVAAPQPEAIQRPSYEAVPEPPPDFEARFGPTMPGSALTPPPTSPELPPDLDARFGPGPDADPEAGMEVDPTPEAELTPQLRTPFMSVQDTTGEAVRRQAPAHGPTRSTENDARRAMEELARTDPHGMAARHGFHAGDRLKTPHVMRLSMSMRIEGYAPDPQPTPRRDAALPDPAPQPTPEPSLGRGPSMGGMEAPAPLPKAIQRPSYEAAPEVIASDPGRLTRAVAAARERLAELGQRLDAAFGRIRNQVLGHEAAAAAASRPTPEIPKPAERPLQPERIKPMDDNAAVIREAMRQQQPAPAREAEREAEAKRQRSIWDDFKRLRMRGPGGGFQP